MQTFAALRKAALSVAVLLASGVAAAATTFSGGFSLSGSAYTDPGLVVQTSPSSGLGSFDLQVGQSTTFKLFDIWTNETSVNFDDTIARTLLATFSLSSPVSSGSATGSTQGHGGILQYGTLNWAGPASLAFGNGGLLTISLSNATFNWGLFGLSPGQKHGATVYATATYAVAPVPVPAAGVAMAGGLGLLAFFRRRRAAA